MHGVHFRIWTEDRPIIYWAILLIASFFIGVTIYHLSQLGRDAVCTIDDKSPALCLRNWLNAAGNLAAVFIAAVAAAFTYRQAQAAKAMAGADRAWLISIDFPLERHAPSDDQQAPYLSFKVCLKNCGRTPALKTSLFISARFSTVEIADPFPSITSENIRNNAGIIAPDGSFYSRAVTMTRAVVDAFVDGKTNCYVYQHVHYTTIYGLPAETVTVSKMHLERFFLDGREVYRLQGSPWSERQSAT